MIMRRILAAALAVFVFCITGPVATTAQAQMVAGQSAPVLVGGKRDLYPGAAVALDFAALRGAKTYKSGGVIASTLTGLPGVSVTRSTGGYAEQQNGALVWFNSGQPRITDKGLLVEEGRANLLARSNEFDTSPWVSISGTVTANASLAPDGSQTASALGAAIRYQSSVVPSGSSVFSIYAKAGSTSQITLKIDVSGNGRQITYDLSSGVAGASTTLGTGGTVTSVSGSTSALPNGWYRCLLFVTTSGVNNASFVASSNIFGWGAQLEPGAYASSYWPTTSASTSRAADDIKLGGLTASAGTLVASVDLNTTTTTVAMASLNDGTSNERNSILAGAGGNGTFRNVSGGTQTNPAAVTYGSSQARLTGAMAWSASRSMGAFNGVLASSAGAPSAVPAYNTLQLGADPSNPATSFYIRLVALYPRVLSDTEVSAVSSGVDTSSLRLDFASGTYKNAAGYVRTNYAVNSQTFAGWLGSASATANATTAPDGTLTGAKLRSAAGSVYQSIYVQPTFSVSGTTITRSVYAKAAEYSWVYLQQYDGVTNKGAYFNLSTGQVGNIDAGVTASITPAAGGWYRLAVTYTAAGGATYERVQITLAQANGGSPTFTGDGTSGVYVWRPQFELSGYPSTDIPTGNGSASVTTYTSTNPADVGNMTFTRASTGYAEDAQGNLVLFGSNVPRITNKGVLIEPAATNILPYSFDDTPAQIWSNLVGATISTGSLTPRAQGATVTLMTTTSTNGRIQRNLVIPNDSLTRTFAIDVEKKAISYEIGTGAVGGTTVGVTVLFDALTGSITAGSGVVESKGAWWRVSIPFTNNGTGNTTAYAYVQANGPPGTTAQVALADMEVGSVATSYKPSRANTNFARAADVFYYSGLSSLLSASHTLAAMATPITLIGYIPRLIDANDGTTAAAEHLAYSSPNLYANTSSGGAGAFFAPVAGAPYSLAMASPYPGTARASGAGAAAATTSSATYGTLTRLDIGNRPGADRAYSNFIQRVAVFPYAANDNELPYRSAGNF